MAFVRNLRPLPATRHAICKKTLGLALSPGAFLKPGRSAPRGIAPAHVPDTCVEGHGMARAILIIAGLAAGAMIGALVFFAV